MAETVSLCDRFPILSTQAAIASHITLALVTKLMIYLSNYVVCEATFARVEIENSTQLLT